jgi:hypothetical protein
MMTTDQISEILYFEKELKRWTVSNIIDMSIAIHRRQTHLNLMKRQMW